jgi:hypothetical protein
MSNRAVDQDEAPKRPGKLAAAALRAIDACLGALQRLRKRFTVPAEDEDSSGQGGKRSQSAADQPPVVVAGAPGQKTLLHRALIVLLCLLLGGVGGALFSYRGLAKMLATRGAAIEQLQEEIDLSKKEEARSLNLTARYQKENSEYRQQSREAQREVENYKSRIEELGKELTAMKRVEAPAPRGARVAPAAAPAKPSAPQKSGNCVVGTANPSGNLTDCIEKFNRQ